MPYLNQVGTLADVVGTPAAAMQAGQETGGQQQQMDLQNQLAQQTMQAKIQQASLQNQQTAAQTGQIQANTTGTNLQNQATQATQPGAIAATNAKNKLSVSTDGIQAVSQLGQLAGQVAGMMDNIPPAARPAAMTQIAQRYGINPSDLGPLANGDPDQLRQMATNSALMSQKLLQEQSLQNSKQQSEQTIAGMHDMTTLQGKQMDNDARTQQAQMRVQAQQASLSTDKRIAQLTQAASQYQQQGQPVPPAIQNELQSLASFKASLAQAIGPQLVSGQQVDTPQQRATQSFNYNGNQSGGGVQPPAADISGTPAMKSAASSAFGSYEPDKYMYRIGPDGSVQRKAK